MNYPSYLGMQMELARISASMSAPHLEMVKQIESILGPYHQQKRLLDEMTKIAQLPNMAIASQSLVSAFKAIQIDTPHFEKMVNIHNILSDRLLPNQNMAEEIQKSAKLALGMSSYITAIAESIRAQIDYNKFYTTLRLEESVISNFAKRIASTENSFLHLVSSFAELPKLAERPLFIMPSASREMLVSEYAIAELSSNNEKQDEENCYSEVVADIQKETSDVQQRIEKLNPQLAIAYQGAKDAFQSKRPDYARHVLSSLREMWNNLLWTLAPNDTLTNWIGNNLQYIHKGKPTRKARIDYICREFNHEPLSNFLSQDTKAFIEMVNFFNRVHNLDNGLTDKQLRALILRSDSWLMFILQIYEEGN